MKKLLMTAAATIFGIVSVFMGLVGLAIIAAVTLRGIGVIS